MLWNRPLAIVVASTLGFTSMGCLTRAFQAETLAATRELMEIENQEVMDNIVRFAVNPGSMPRFGIVSQGVFQMNDTVTVTPGLTWSPSGLMSTMLGFSGQRAGSNQWTMTPIYDPEKLKKMRCLFRHAVNPADVDPCYDNHAYLASLSVLAKPSTTLTTATADVPETCGIPTGFYRCGRKCDVSARACFVAHHGSLWLWVEPEGLDGLTRLTLLVLDVATAVPPQTTTKESGKVPVGHGLGVAPAEGGVTIETTTGGRMQFAPGGLQFSR
jgi:hypothetical protein